MPSAVADVSLWTMPAVREDAVRRLAEEDDLRAGTAALGMLATKGLGLESLLIEVAGFAVRAVPGADGAGLMLLETSQRDVVVMTHPFVGGADDVQYRLGNGPSFTAAASGRTVISGSLGADARWPRFGATVARLGIHSALALPLLTSSGLVGTLNVYARAKHAFGERAAELGEIFAVPAGIAVENAQVLAVAQRLAIKLQVTHDARAVIDRAVGICMSRSGESNQKAEAGLRQMSQHGHRKLAEIAQGVVDQAVQQARRRHRTALD